MRGDFIYSDKPFLFSVKVPEGNYRVTVTLGDAAGESLTTIKAELRRLMLEKVHTDSGKFKTCELSSSTSGPPRSQVAARSGSRTARRPWSGGPGTTS